MTDEVHGVVARHVLLLQEIDGVALALGEQRNENIGAAHVFAAGRLDADDRPLDDPLEARGRLAFVGVFVDEIVELAIDIVAQILGQQVEIDGAGPQHGRRVDILHEAQQKVFERRIFMVTLTS